MSQPNAGELASSRTSQRGRVMTNAFRKAIATGAGENTRGGSSGADVTSLIRAGIAERVGGAQMRAAIAA